MSTFKERLREALLIVEQWEVQEGKWIRHQALRYIDHLLRYKHYPPENPLVIPKRKPLLETCNAD